MTKDNLHCTMCAIAVAPGTKYLVVSRPAEGGIKIEVGCSHKTPENLSEAVAVLGGTNCAMKWFHEFLYGLRCDHQNEAGGANG